MCDSLPGIAISKALGGRGLDALLRMQAPGPTRQERALSCHAQGQETTCTSVHPALQPAHYVACCWSCSAHNCRHALQALCAQAVAEKQKAEDISAVLYPNDSTEYGKELRLKQQVFFVSASIQDVLSRFKVCLAAQILALAASCS